MPPQNKSLSPDDKEVIPESQPDATVEIAAGVELPKVTVDPPEREMNEWERAGVRPPQAYR